MLACHFVHADHAARESEVAALVQQVRPVEGCSAEDQEIGGRDRDTPPAKLRRDPAGLLAHIRHAQATDGMYLLRQLLKLLLVTGPPQRPLGGDPARPAPAISRPRAAPTRSWSWVCWMIAANGTDTGHHHCPATALLARVDGARAPCYPRRMDERRDEREEMVARQIESRGIRDARVLAAMRETPRHLFVPEGERRSAYGDHALPIGQGQTISQPYMVALMCYELAAGPEDWILEIGAGSGYQAAVLSHLACEVIAVERIPALAEQARGNLRAAGCDNVRVVVGDGTLGWPEDAPYDRIIVAAAAPDLPEPLVEQLAEGGRLVVPVGQRGYQQLIVAEKVGGQVRQRTGCQCVFVPLIGEHGWVDGW